MAKTYSTLISDRSGRNINVPGKGLAISVIVNSEAITIMPEMYGPDDRTSEFAFSHTQAFYSFRPEAYKRFWKWLSTSEERCFVQHPERMREALNFALKVYRAKFGEIFN
jgi:hypothetical protein